MNSEGRGGEGCGIGAAEGAFKAAEGGGRNDGAAAASPAGGDGPPSKKRRRRGKRDREIGHLRPICRAGSARESSKDGKKREDRVASLEAALAAEREASASLRRRLDDLLAEEARAARERRREEAADGELRIGLPDGTGGGGKALVGRTMSLQVPHGSLGVEIVSSSNHGGLCVVNNISDKSRRNVLRTGDIIQAVSIPIVPAHASSSAATGEADASASKILAAWSKIFKATNDLCCQNASSSAAARTLASSTGEMVTEATASAAAATRRTVQIFRPRSDVEHLRDILTARNRFESGGGGGADRILLLDGGVSTHLEDSCGATFKHRELWSSSLLLPQPPSEGGGDSADNLERVRRGHMDWLGAGSNIITTVTYQLHYQSHFLPRKREAVGFVNEENQQAPLLTEQQIDKMYDTAIDLAVDSIRQYKEKAKNGGAAAVAASPAWGGATNRHDRPLFALVSMGCFGGALANGAEYTGDYNQALSNQQSPPSTLLYSFHRRRLDYLSARQKERQNEDAAEVAAVIETVPNVEECRAISLAIASTGGDGEENGDAPEATTAAVPSGVNVAWVSLACRDGGHLNDGTPVATALDALMGAIRSGRLWGIGFNCCKGDYLIGLVTILLDFIISNRLSDPHPIAVAVVLYPNSGEGWDADAKVWTGTKGGTRFSDMMFRTICHVEDYWRQHAPEGSQVPTVVVGGCCRTRPEDILSLRKRVDQHLMASDG